MVALTLKCQNKHIVYINMLSIKFDVFLVFYPRNVPALWNMGFPRHPIYRWMYSPNFSQITATFKESKSFLWNLQLGPNEPCCEDSHNILFILEINMT